MKIVYVGDPMCSWCYGISNEIASVKDHFKNRLGFKLVVGGLRAGGGDQWNAKFTDFLKHHWEEVNERSGVPFSYGLLAKDHFEYDTEPSCRASVVVRSMNPSIEMDFFKAIQNGFYLENKDPKQTIFYKSICEEFGLDYTDFKSKFESKEYKDLTIQDFQYSAKIGVRSFPTILIEKDGMLYKVASGYATKEVMISRIEEIMSN